MLARESKVPPGFSGAVRAFLSGRGFRFPLDDSAVIRVFKVFNYTHTWWRIWIEHFSIRNNMSDLVLKRATWTEIYFYIRFGQKPSWTQRTDEISLWSLEPHLDIKSVVFFFWVQDHFATEPPLGYNHMRGFGRVRHFLTREHFVNPAAVEHLLLAFWKSCGRSYFYLSQKNRQNMLRVIIMSVFRIIIGQWGGRYLKE